MFYLNILRNSSGLIHVFIVLFRDTIVCRKEWSIGKVITNFWGFKDTETAGVNYATFRYHEHTNTDRLQRGSLCVFCVVLSCVSWKWRALVFRIRLHNKDVLLNKSHKNALEQRAKRTEQQAKRGLNYGGFKWLDKMGKIGLSVNLID